MKATSIFVLMLSAIFSRATNAQTQSTETFNPAGKLVFSACPDAKLPTTYSSALSEICVLDITKKTILRLTYNNYKDEEPSWSPDGKEIIFTSMRSYGGILAENGARHLFIMDIDNRKTTQLDRDFDKYGLDDNSSPSWSPSGREVAFVSHQIDSVGLVLYDIATKRVRVIARAERIPGVLWSPTSAYIAYKDVNNVTDSTAEADNIILGLQSSTKMILPSGPTMPMNFVTWIDSTRILVDAYESGLKIWDVHLKKYVPGAPKIPKGFQVVDVGLSSGTFILLGERGKPGWQQDLWLYNPSSQALERLTDDGLEKSDCHVYRSP